MEIKSKIQITPKIKFGVHWEDENPCCPNNGNFLFQKPFDCKDHKAAVEAKFNGPEIAIEKEFSKSRLWCHSCNDYHYLYNGSELITIEVALKAIKKQPETASA